MRHGRPPNVRALIDIATDSGSCADPATCAVCKAVPRRPWMDGILKVGPVSTTGWCPTHFQPYAALLHALLIPRYSWVFGHIVTLKLLRHLLLEGPIDERGLTYLTNNGPMLAAILRLHPTAGVPRQYGFPAAESATAYARHLLGQPPLFRAQCQPSLGLRPLPSCCTS
jgi:hypothetical protein